MSWLITPEFKTVLPYMWLYPQQYGLPQVGDSYGGGFHAGLISHTTDGNPTHVLIVAPASTGATGTDYTLTTMLQWKTANTATANTTSDFDGAANTAAMVTAGIADHPAANFCVGLSIGGFTDWYLPSRYELDIAYEGLKPSTVGSASSGINPYAIPARTINRLSNQPGQTSVLAFRTGGGEAFIASDHWSSTEFTTVANAWRITMSSGALASNAGKSTFTYRVRAFRRIAL